MTGACGVGKTSTAVIWSSIKQGVVIECDNLRECLDKEDFPQWSDKEENFIAKMSAMMATEYLKNGMSVAIENVWSPESIELIRKELFRMRGLTIKTVLLKCDLEENHRRDQERVPENQMKERVKIVKEKLENYKWPSYVNVLDTTKLNFDEVFAELDKLS